jgi:GrpB-like predicted nucleotidyltransferase (UPF0157 family)
LKTAGIRIVGGQEWRPKDAGTESRRRFLTALVPRLSSETWDAGPVTRFIGFQGTAPDRGEFEFLGIEVDRFGDIPPGLVAWEIEGSRLVMREGHRGTEEEASLSWIWLDMTSDAPRPWTGEPSVAGTAHLPPTLFLTSISWTARPPENPASDEVALQDYDPSWPTRYRELEQWLRSRVGDAAGRIEHYGSTAIPGLPAKPVVDVLVEVADFQSAKQRFLPRLNHPQWEYWWYVDHPLFVRRSRLMGERTHHVHLATPGHRLWEGITFRDRLRAHPEQAAEYAELKRQWADANRTDREAYTEAKTTFVRRVVSRAP